MSISLLPINGIQQMLFGLSANGFFSRISNVTIEVRYGDITTYENLATKTRKGGQISFDREPLNREPE